METGDQSTDAAKALTDRLDYPMYVVTTIAGEEPSGCLAGFVVQCSIEPVRFFVCVSVQNHTFDVLEHSAVLGLHLLGTDQEPMAARFGERTGDQSDKFAGVAWRPGRTGAPLLEDCAAWVEGRVIDRLPVGDHRGHVLDVVAGGTGDRPGRLMYHQVRHLQAGHPADEPD